MANSALFPNGTVVISALSAINGSSIFECWAINPGFTVSSQQGTSGAAIMQLGGLANASYSVIPPHFDAGLHQAPNNQSVISLRLFLFRRVFIRLVYQVRHVRRRIGTYNATSVVG